jgi:arogenate dehydrogenase (NADP+)
MISAALVNVVNQKAEPNILQLSQNLASSGFRDTSRVGGGNPELGMMMAIHNRSALLNSLLDYREVLGQIIEVITQEDWQTLEEILKHSQKVRSQFISIAP